jgi:hypothetical protein
MCLSDRTDRRQIDIAAYASSFHETMPARFFGAFSGFLQNGRENWRISSAIQVARSAA